MPKVKKIYLLDYYCYNLSKSVLIIYWSLSVEPIMAAEPLKRLEDLAFEVAYQLSRNNIQLVTSAGTCKPQS